MPSDPSVEDRAHEALYERVRLAREKAAKSTVAIIGVNSKEMVVQGSGTLFEVASHTFIITAAHVTDGFGADIPEPMAFGVPGKRGDPVVPLADAPIYFVEPPFEDSANVVQGNSQVSSRARKTRTDDLIDVAVVELSEEQSTELKKKYEFLRLYDVDTRPIRSDSWFLFCGSPAERFSLVDQRVKTPMSSILAKTHDKNAEESQDYGFLLAFNQQDELVSREGALSPTPDPRGMSGGGVWRLMDPDQKGEWTVDSVRLVGIEHTHNPTEKWVRCTRLGVAQQVILHHYPKLARAFDLVLPPPGSHVGHVLPARHLPPWHGAPQR